MAAYICAKQYRGVLVGGGWYGDEPYCHSFVDKPGEDCAECKAVIKTIEKQRDKPIISEE